MKKEAQEILQIFQKKINNSQIHVNLIQMKKKFIKIFI